MNLYYTLVKLSYKTSKMVFNKTVINNAFIVSPLIPFHVKKESTVLAWETKPISSEHHILEEKKNKK